MKEKDYLWWIGQAVSVAIGVALGYEYNVPVGVAAFYVIAFLVDIRDEVTR